MRQRQQQVSPVVQSSKASLIIPLKFPWLHLSWSFLLLFLFFFLLSFSFFSFSSPQIFSFFLLAVSSVVLTSGIPNGLIMTLGGCPRSETRQKPFVDCIFVYITSSNSRQWTPLFTVPRPRRELNRFILHALTSEVIGNYIDWTTSQTHCPQCYLWLLLSFHFYYFHFT